MNALRPIFAEKTALRAAVPCVVNYVWINNIKIANIKGHPPCGVPLHYVDRAIKNAKAYPETPFQLWVDPAYWPDLATLDIVGAHLKKNGVANITIRDLHDIKKYDRKAFFKPGTFAHGSVWHRVDLARLLVTLQTLDECPDRVAVYSDFDTPDVLIEDARFNRAIDECGLALGAILPGKSSKDPSEGFFENSYFAMTSSKRNRDLIAKIVANSRRRLFMNSAAGKSALYLVYRDAVHAFMDEYLPGKRRDCLLSAVMPMGYKIPVNLAYHGISSVRPLDLAP